MLATILKVTAAINRLQQLPKIIQFTILKIVQIAEEMKLGD